MAQCAAKKKDGTQCQILVREGQRYCHVHRNQRTWRWILSALGIGAVLLGILGFVANITGVLAYFGINPPPLLHLQSTEQNRPFDSFELIIDLPKNNKAMALGDYDTMVHILAAGQIDCDVTFEVRFLSARFPFRETLYFTSGLRDLRVYILPYDDKQWSRPPTWESYVINWDEKFRNPVLLYRNQNDKNLLSIRAERNDLAQLGTEVTIRSIEGWDTEVAITWRGPNVKDIYSMMDKGGSMKWLHELPAIVKINGLKVWQGTLSQKSSRVADFLPYKVDRGGIEVWEFTKHYGTNPQPPSIEK